MEWIRASQIVTCIKNRSAKSRCNDFIIVMTESGFGKRRVNGWAPGDDAVPAQAQLQNECHSHSQRLWYLERILRRKWNLGFHLRVLGWNPQNWRPQSRTSAKTRFPDAPGRHRSTRTDWGLHYNRPEYPARTKKTIKTDKNMYSIMKDSRMKTHSKTIFWPNCLPIVK